MNPSATNSDDTHIDLQFSTFPDETNQAINAPLLMHRLSNHHQKSKSISLPDELIRNFQISLKWCALDHSTCAGKVVSFTAFILLAIAVPLASSVVIPVPTLFTKLVHIPESGLAIISFFTLSGFFGRHGIRQLLFLDHLQEDLPHIQRDHRRALDKAFRYLACILLPSFLVEVAHKIMLFSSLTISVPFLKEEIPVNSMVFVLVLGSWVYRTGVFLLVCVLFRLTCELQILRFEGIHKLLSEGCGSEAGVIFEEHMRIRKQLSFISHRYRFFIIGCMVTITVSQLGALLLVLESKSEKSFINSGDLVVCSAVELSGFLLCLMGAARITHRAQGVVSVASRWHMLVTSNALHQSADQHINKEDKSHVVMTLDGGAIPADSKSHDSSQSYIKICSHPSASHFHTRQALVNYLQHNNGGITLFGFVLDRGLLHTIFAFESSLVLWILSKEVVLS